MSDFFDDFDDTPLQPEIVMNQKPKKKISGMKIIAVILLVALLVGGGVLIGYFAAPGTRLGQDMPEFVKAYQYLKKYYYQDITWEEFQYMVIAGMMGIDNYSGIYETETDPSPSVGMSLTRTLYNEYYVTYVYPSSPAGRAGIERGDRIYAVNGYVVEGADYSLYSQLYAEDDDVTFTFYKTNGTEVTKTLTKTTLIYGSLVNYQTLQFSAGKVGYIDFRSFDDSAVSAMDAAVAGFLASNRLYGTNKLILDLRNNGGGSVSVLQKIAPYFVVDEKGNNDQLPLMKMTYKSGETAVMLSEAKREGRENIRYLGDMIDGFELVVLVNGNSASASEALAANIVYYETGVLVGSTTYGKGVAQVTIELNDKYELWITAATYDVLHKTAGGISEYYNYHGVGLSPSAENTISTGNISDLYHNDLKQELAVAHAAKVLLGT